MPPNDRTISGRVEKSRPIEYFPQMVVILVGHRKRRFSIHESLLCEYSCLFKNLYRKDQKPIENDCPICSEELAGTDDCTTYCYQCKVNFHLACMREWSNKQKTCPTCPAKWKLETLRFHKSLTHDPKIFHSFEQWLYRGEIPLYNGEEVGSDMRYLRLLKAYQLGKAFQAEKFQKYALAEILQDVEDIGKMLGSESLDFIYGDSEEGDSEEGSNLRRFVVRLFVTKAAPDILKKEINIDLLKDTMRAVMMKEPLDDESFRQDLRVYVGKKR